MARIDPVCAPAHSHPHIYPHADSAPWQRDRTHGNGHTSNPGCRRDSGEISDGERTVTQTTGKENDRSSFALRYASCARVLCGTASTAQQATSLSPTAACVHGTDTMDMIHNSSANENTTGRGGQCPSLPDRTPVMFRPTPPPHARHNGSYTRESKPHCQHEHEQEEIAIRLDRADEDGDVTRDQTRAHEQHLEEMFRQWVMRTTSTCHIAAQMTSFSCCPSCRRHHHHHHQQQQKEKENTPRGGGARRAWRPFRKSPLACELLHNGLSIQRLTRCSPVLTQEVRAMRAASPPSESLPRRCGAGDELTHPTHRIGTVDHDTLPGSRKASFTVDHDMSRRGRSSSSSSSSSTGAKSRVVGGDVDPTHTNSHHGCCIGACADVSEDRTFLQRLADEPVYSYALLQALALPPSSSALQPTPQSAGEDSPRACVFAPTLCFPGTGTGAMRGVEAPTERRRQRQACWPTAPTVGPSVAERRRVDSRECRAQGHGSQQDGRKYRDKTYLGLRNGEEDDNGATDTTKAEKKFSNSVAMRRWLKQYELHFRHRRYMRCAKFRDYLDWRLRCRRLMIHQLLDNAPVETTVRGGSRRAVRETPSCRAEAHCTTPTCSGARQTCRTSSRAAAHRVRSAPMCDDRAAVGPTGARRVTSQGDCTARRRMTGSPNTDSSHPLRAPHRPRNECLPNQTLPKPRRVTSRDGGSDGVRLGSALTTPRLASGQPTSPEPSHCWDTLYRVFAEHPFRAEARAGRRSRNIRFHGVWVAKAMEQMVQHERERVCEAVARFEPPFAAAVLSVQAMHRLRDAIVDKIRHKPLHEVTDIYVTPREMMRYLIEHNHLSTALQQRHVVKATDVIEAMPSAAESALVAHVFDVLQPCQL